MDILDMDILLSFLTNADDSPCHDHKRISQSRIPQISKQQIIFNSSLDKKKYLQKILSRLKLMCY
jgi:hypothetical protein